MNTDDHVCPRCREIFKPGNGTRDTTYRCSEPTCGKRFSSMGVENYVTMTMLPEDIDSYNGGQDERPHTD